MLLTVLHRQFSDENKICANVWRPCFFRVNPTYGVLPYSIIYTQAHILACGMGPEKACDSATGVPKYRNHLRIHLVSCIGRGCGAWKSLRQCDRYVQIWKSFFAYTPSGLCSHGCIGPERACDSATGGPINRNHLHPVRPSH